MIKSKAPAAIGRNLAPTRSVSRHALFLAFFKIGICGFGGVAGWVRPVLVDERGWLTDQEFAETHGAASILPGANTVNLAVMLGDRFQGPSGAAVAVFGLMLAPLTILIGLASLYDRVADLPDVKAALAGAAAATAGLVIGNAWRLIRAQNGDWLALFVSALVFAAIGFFHLSLAATLAIAVPGSFALFALARSRG